MRFDALPGADGERSFQSRWVRAGLRTERESLPRGTFAPGECESETYSTPESRSLLLSIARNRFRAKDKLSCVEF